MIRKILVTVFLIMVVSVVAESDWRYWLGRDEVGSSYMNVSSEIETLPDNFDKTVIEQSADIALLGEVDGDNPGLELVTWDGEQVKTFDMNLKLLNTFTPAGM